MLTQWGATLVIQLRESCTLALASRTLHAQSRSRCSGARRGSPGGGRGRTWAGGASMMRVPDEGGGSSTSVHVAPYYTQIHRCVAVYIQCSTSSSMGGLRTSIGALLTTWGQPSSSRSISASSAPVTSSQSILLPLANFPLSTCIASPRTAVQPS